MGTDAERDFARAADLMREANVLHSERVLSFSLACRARYTGGAGASEKIREAEASMLESKLSVYERMVGFSEATIAKHKAQIREFEGKIRATQEEMAALRAPFQNQVSTNRGF